jgi:hypothetical protein
LNLTTEQWYVVLLAGAAVLLAAGGVVAWWRRRPRDPAEAERRRRAHLNQIGRIVEGHIQEIEEFGVRTSDPLRVPPPPSRGARPQGVSPGLLSHRQNGQHRVVFYSYSISGVTYETAQDVTGLEERACLERLVAGQPVSVKYDPANPSNSILIADDWSGLH